MTDLVLGDDHKLFLDALATVLAQRGFTVSAVACSVAETIESVRQKKPDVCLIDRHFAGHDGLDAIGEILAASGHTKVIVISANRGRESVIQALNVGASGYLHKTREVSVLAAAIDRVLGGEVVVDVPTPTATWRSAPPDHPRRLAAYLTARERECLALLVRGLSTAAMADVLGVSRTTVRTHVQALLAKLGVHSRLEAVSLAVRYGLLDDELGYVRTAPAM